MRNRLPFIMMGFVFLSATMALAQGRGGRGGPPGGRGGPFGRGGTERLADDLTLSNDQRDQMRTALQAYDQVIRQQTLQARTDLLEKMQGILPQEQFNQFKDQLSQVPLVAQVPPIRGVATSDLVDRLMSFDKNQDGTITKDELPERMANLLDQGDTNHDGALDNAEIKNLADRNSVNDQPPGRGGRGRRGGPPPGGFGQGF
jgi:hypothetical protein